MLDEDRLRFSDPRLGMAEVDGDGCDRLDEPEPIELRDGTLGKEVMFRLPVR